MKKRKGGIVYDTEKSHHLGSTLGLSAWRTHEGRYFIISTDPKGRSTLLLGGFDRNGLNMDPFFDKLLGLCGVERL